MSLSAPRTADKTLVRNANGLSTFDICTRNRGLCGFVVLIF